MPMAPWRSTHRSRSSIGGVWRSQLRMKVIQCQHSEASTIDTLQDSCEPMSFPSFTRGTDATSPQMIQHFMFLSLQQLEGDLVHLCFKHHCISEAHVKLAANLLLTLVHSLLSHC